MQLKRTIKALFTAAVFLPTWIAWPGDASAVQFFRSPFGDLRVTGYVANYSDGYWVTWLLPGRDPCSGAIHQYIAPSSGLTDHVFVEGGEGNDTLWERVDGDVCGYPVIAPAHNGYTLAFFGHGGRDDLFGWDSKTYLSGQSGNDHLDGMFVTQFIGGEGDDDFCGGTIDNGSEQYLGGNGYDELRDVGQMFARMDSIEAPYANGVVLGCQYELGIY